MVDVRKEERWWTRPGFGFEAQKPKDASSIGSRADKSDMIVIPSFIVRSKRPE